MRFSAIIKFNKALSACRLNKMRGPVRSAFLPLTASAAPSPKPKSSDLSSLQYSVNALNTYIVILKNDISEASFEEHISWVRTIHSQAEKERTELREHSQSSINGLPSGINHVYDIATAFNGYSGDFDEKTINKIKSRSDVSFQPILSRCKS